MKRTEPASKPQVWPLEKIIPYPNNPRTHPDQQVELLATLMQKHGVDQPIVVDEEGFILKGHGRRMAAVKAGFEDFPVVIHRGLSDADKRAIRLADNQVALLSGWNEDLLRAELTDLSKAGYDMPLLGFDDVSLVTFMAMPPRAGADPDQEIEPPAKPVSRAGDLWLLGKHRLLCGDSTNEKDVELLLGDDVPNLMVTDQPYGIDYDAGWRDSPENRANPKMKRAAKPAARGAVMNDDRADWREAWRLFPGNVAYVWTAGLRSRESVEGLEAAGFEMVAQIIWAKNNFAIGRGDYHFQHEPCWYAVRKGKRHNWAGDRSQTTLWQIDKPQKSETGHSTQKPVECMRRPIQNNSKPGDYVYEPFMGSGTTMIAAEMMNRYALGLELNPAYVDVAVERWQAFTKQEATLEGDGRTYAAVAAARKKAPAKKTGATPKGTGAKRRAQAAE